MIVMQQFFVEEPLVVGQDYQLTKEQAHHAKDVVRLHQETIRLVSKGIGYFATIDSSQKDVIAHVESQDPRINELDVDITLCMALIRREKMELVLQKATELGVKRIIPFVSERCVVKEKKEKSDKLIARWNTILLEAAQQCKRNQVPELLSIQSWKDLGKVDSTCKVIAYENAYGESESLTRVCRNQKSVAVVIGPEGGFSEKEVEAFLAMGYQPITLGNRILRAETAAMHACSVIGACSELESEGSK